jgi:CRP-like cAMP-binding protein
VRKRGDDVAVEREGIRGSRWEGVFRGAGFWRDASEVALDNLVDQAVIQRCRKGEVLFSEGSIGDRALVILQGYIRGVHYETTGHVVVLEVLGPGDVVGVISAFAEAPFEGDVEAGAGTVVAVVPVTAIEELISSGPEVAMSVVRSMARRWVAVVSAAKRNATTVPSRLARYITELPRTRLGPSSYSVQIPTKRVELAATLATSPETLSRSFHRLRDEGLIEDAGRKVTVLDDQLLHLLAEGE